MDSPHSTNAHHRPHPLSHAQAAQALSGGSRGEGSSVDPEDDIDSGCSDDEDGVGVHHPLMEEEIASSQVCASIRTVGL